MFDSGWGQQVRDLMGDSWARAALAVMAAIGISVVVNLGLDAYSKLVALGVRTLLDEGKSKTAQGKTSPFRS